MSTHEQHGNEAEAGSGAGLGAHVLPLKLLAGVWIALATLTWVTVAASHLNLGSLGLWVALGIATTKAGLVALYFMHLRYDRPINAIIFLGALLFVLLFVGLALTDTRSYQPDLIPGYAPGMQP